MKSQLFKEFPPIDLIIEIIKLYGLKDMDDIRSFTRKDLSKLNTVHKLKDYKEVLCNYYIPCKSRLYLNELNEKNIITILKTINYTIDSREKCLKGNKFITYRIIPINNKQYKPLKINNNQKTILQFD